MFEVRFKTLGIVNNEGKETAINVAWSLGISWFGGIHLIKHKSNREIMTERLMKAIIHRSR